MDIMEFLENLNAETLKSELITFIENDFIEIVSMNDFVEQFIDYIKEDLSYGDSY